MQYSIHLLCHLRGHLNTSEDCAHLKRGELFITTLYLCTYLVLLGKQPAMYFSGIAVGVLILPKQLESWLQKRNHKKNLFAKKKF